MLSCASEYNSTFGVCTKHISAWYQRNHPNCHHIKRTCVGSASMEPRVGDEEESSSAIPSTEAGTDSVL